MIFLNLIYYLIITWYGYKFLKSEGGILKDPFDKDEYIELSGPEMYWVLTFSTGLLAFSAPLGIDLMAVRLATIMLLCIIGFKLCENKPIWAFPLKLYVIYLVWLLIGCTYAPSLTYGLRVTLKYTYPLVFCLFASAVTDNFKVSIKASLLARKVAVISLIFSFVPLIHQLVPGVFWYGTAKAIHYISIMTLSIALFFFTDEKKNNFGYSVLFLLPCFVWVLRTSILGSGIAIIVFSIIRWRTRSLPIIAGVLVAGIIAVFTIPSLRHKMFKKETTNVSIENFQQGGISMDNVETNAREAMWTFFENKMYHGHELIGSGTGSVQQYMYTHYVFGGLTVIHSDLTQIKCDNGLIGLILYCSIVICILIHCFKIYWDTDDERKRFFAIVAGASMAGVFVTLYSDNTVNYSMATLAIPFGFYGMAIALNKRLDDEENI